jgi:4'-phosphopantetheinyl transferase EntD
MIAELLPTSVASADAFEDPPDATLWPGEHATVARALERRRREFTTARVCARAALARLGMEPAAIVPDQRGVPVWPTGIVGSITHCDGYRAAAVARESEVVTIGVDAEPNEPLPSGVLPLVSRAEERIHLARLAAERPDVCWDRLLFSVKESVYKAWFPLTRRWLGFEQALVTFDPGTGTFSAQLRDVASVGRITGFRGRWLVRDGLALTATTITGVSEGALDRSY